MEESKIVRWLKKEGDYVERGDVIAEIEAEQEEEKRPPEVKPQIIER